MVEVDEIESILVSLGEASENIAAVTRNSETEWAVAFDEDCIILLHLLADQGKIVLSTSLGAPAADNRLEIYETLLSYNVLWAETGGVKMGVGGAHGEVMQMFELTTMGLDREVLGLVLANFAAKAATWRRFVVAGPDREPQPRVADQQGPQNWLKA